MNVLESVIMKRIEAFVPNTKRSRAVEAAIKAGAEGVTIAETRGRGSGERPTVGSARGTARYIAEYSRTDTLIAIVDDSKVESVVQAIIEAVHTGSRGDGKIFITNVEKSYDISAQTSSNGSMPKGYKPS